MIRLGFGEDILDHVEEMIEETTNGFTHLGQRLGWPKKKQTPSAARLKYLYAALRENQVCVYSLWDCGMVTGTC